VVWETSIKTFFSYYTNVEGLVSAFICIVRAQSESKTSGVRSEEHREY